MQNRLGCYPAACNTTTTAENGHEPGSMSGSEISEADERSGPPLISDFAGWEISDDATINLHSSGVLARAQHQQMPMALGNRHPYTLCAGPERGGSGPCIFSNRKQFKCLVSICVSSLFCSQMQLISSITDAQPTPVSRYSRYSHPGSDRLEQYGSCYGNLEICSSGFFAASQKYTQL